MSPLAQLPATRGLVIRICRSKAQRSTEGWSGRYRPRVRPGDSGPFCMTVRTCRASDVAACVRRTYYLLSLSIGRLCAWRMSSHSPTQLCASCLPDIRLPVPSSMRQSITAGCLGVISISMWLCRAPPRDRRCFVWLHISRQIRRGELA